jgi:hypothetical protein
MNADEIINIVKESILSEIQNNPVIIQYVKEVSLVQSNIHIHYENGTASEIFNIIVVDRKFGKCYRIKNLFTDYDCKKLSTILEKTFKQLYNTIETIKSGSDTNDFYLDFPTWHFECAPKNSNEISDIDLRKMELLYKL